MDWAVAVAVVATMAVVVVVSSQNTLAEAVVAREVFRDAVPSSVGVGVPVGVGFQLVGNLLAFATLPRKSEIAKREFEEARYRAVATTLSLSVDARRAYVRAVAARQQLALLEALLDDIGVGTQFHAPLHLVR